MKYLILFSALFFLSSAAGAANVGTAEISISAMTDYCLPAVSKGLDPAALALEHNLAELPADQAEKFAPGSRVFVVPGSDGAVVLMADKEKGVCSVAVHVTSKDRIWAMIDKKFNSASGFRLLREKRTENEKVTRRDYEADIGGLVGFLVTISDVPRPNGIQALMTMARLQK